MDDDFQQLKELWRAFLKDAPAGVAIFDRDMRYLEASERWKRDYGLVGQDIIGSSHYEIFPEIPEQWKEIHRACLAGASDGRDADPFVRSDGQVDWVRWEIRPWHRDDGAIGGIVIFSEIITDRIRADEALKASEARYRALIEQAPEAIIIYDSETGHMVDANRNAELLFGCDRAELLKGSPDRFYAADQPDGAPIAASMRQHDEIVAAGGSPAFERHIRNAQGKEFFVEIRLSPLPSETGRLLRASVVDITRRKQAEDALREQEARYRGLVEQEIAGIVIVGADGTLAYVNPQFAKMVGWAPTDLVGRPILEIVPDEERAVVAQSLERQMSGQAPFVQLGSKIVTGRGEVRDVLINATRSTHQGRPSSTAVVLDITERRRAEDALRQSEHKYRTTVEIAPVGIVHVAPDGRFLTANEAFGDLLGYPRDELQMMSVQDITSPEDLETLNRQLGNVSAGTLSRGQLVRRFRHRDGRLLWCEVTYSVERDANGRVEYLLSIVNDITERKQAEEERLRFASQLQQAQKMEAIGQLTGGMAHDFNNLLGVVIGNLEFLEDEMKSKSAAREFVEAAITAAERGADLTRHMLAFARRQPLAPKLTDIADALNGAAKLFRRTLGENIMLNIALHERLSPVMVDVAQLEAAILNLAINSRDAMPGGGTLTIEARDVALDAAAATHNPEATPGNYVAISVSDTGIGMPPEIAAKAFDPFFTTKGVHGSGLGLSSVHGFVKQSGGHTRIYSEPGRGTTVAIYLPHAAAATAATGESNTARTTPRGSETVLVTEDNEALRRIAIRHLADLGYRTLAAREAAEALQILASDAPVDLLFTDVVMPGALDGRALAAAARQLRPGLKTLFASGFAAAAVLASGADEFGGRLLSKPYRKDELAHAVRAALDTQP